MTIYHVLVYPPPPGSLSAYIRGDDLEKLSKWIADSAWNHTSDKEFESTYTN